MTYLSGVTVDHYRNTEGEDFVYFFYNYLHLSDTLEYESLVIESVD